MWLTKFLCVYLNVHTLKFNSYYLYFFNMHSVTNNANLTRNQYHSQDKGLPTPNLTELNCRAIKHAVTVAQDNTHLLFHYNLWVQKLGTLKRMSH